MSGKLPAVCLITGGLVESNIRLQPWRYLSEVARQLAARGYPVTVLSDKASCLAGEQEIAGVSVQRLPNVRQPWWRTNSALQEAIRHNKPELILWHVGLTSFLHQRFDGDGRIPTVGIFTSPLYQPREIFRLGVNKLIQSRRLSAVHGLGALLPKQVWRRLANRSKLLGLVVQTQTTRRQLLESGLWSRPIEVIGPGVDQIWGTTPLAGKAETRLELGYEPSDMVVLYFGSPAPLRGLHTLIKAFELARRADSSLKLLVLSRRRPAELLQADHQLQQLLNHNPIGRHIQALSSFLDEKTLARYVAAGDIVALPFELIPSDAPLSLLEAQALNKPVVTTTVGCLAELVSQGVSYLAQPADPTSLAQALQQAAGNLRAPTAHPQGGFIDQPGQTPLRSWSQVGAEWSDFIQKLLR